MGSSAKMMNVHPLHLSNLNVLIGIILHYANGLPGMVLWSAGTPCMFQMLGLSCGT